LQKQQKYRLGEFIKLTLLPSLQHGLLLRSDLHTLFDLRLITLDPKTKQVLIAPKLMQTQYQEFFQKEITLPENETDIPDEKALAKHYTECQWTK
jgi:putative restriction endonuclease